MLLGKFPHGLDVGCISGIQQDVLADQLAEGRFEHSHVGRYEDQRPLGYRPHRLDGGGQVAVGLNRESIERQIDADVVDRVGICGGGFLAQALSVISRIGGAADSASFVLDSSVTYGQAESSTCFAASFIAKARQVGKLHSLQLV
jgi:hypothetical protein